MGEPTPHPTALRARIDAVLVAAVDARDIYALGAARGALHALEEAAARAPEDPTRRGRVSRLLGRRPPLRPLSEDEQRAVLRHHADTLLGHAETAEQARFPEHARSTRAEVAALEQILGDGPPYVLPEGGPLLPPGMGGRPRDVPTGDLDPEA